MVMSSPNVVKATCKQCGQQAPADQFKLHHQFRMMVCPNCYTGKTQKQAEQKAKEAEKPKRPAGWDADDEYLDRASRQKREQMDVQVSKIPGSSYVQYKCAHCKYSFKFNPDTRTPRTCPYCDTEVPKVRLM